MSRCADETDPLAGSRLSSRTRALLAKVRQPVAVVLGLSTATGLSIVRCLGRERVPVVGIDRSQRAIAGYSRYCASVETAADDAGLLQLLEAIAAASLRRPCLYCESDRYLLFVDRNREKMNRLFHLFLSPGIASYAEWMSKSAMTAQALGSGIPVPQTITVTEKGIDARTLENIALPCFIKPNFSQPGEQTKGEIVTDRAGLRDALHRGRFRSGCVVQEMIPGPETGLWEYVGYQGSRHGVGMTFQKIRQIPRDCGVGTVARACANETVARWGAQFIERTRYTGFFGIEFKHDTRDGSYKFIEINCRLMLNNELFYAAGLNLAYIAYCDVTGLPLPAVPKVIKPALWVAVVHDFITSVKYYSRDDRWALGKWLLSVVRADTHADWSWQDPLPFIMNVLEYVRPEKKITGTQSGRELKSGPGENDSSELARGLQKKTARVVSRSERPVAVVLGVSTTTGLSLVRSLGERGIPLVAFDRGRHGLGSFSRYCTSVETARTKEELLSSLLQIGRRSRQKPVILMESDQYVRFIDLYREQLGECFHLVGSARIPLRQLMEKSVMLECARHAGLPVPQTITTKSNFINAREAATMRFPCFIKPLFSQTGERKKVEYAETFAQLMASIQHERFSNGALIQEVIPGPETNLWSYSGFRGEKCCLGVTRYKVRQIPKDFGVGTVTVSAANQEVEELGRKLLEAVDFRGQFGLEFKKDERDGAYKFIEMNMRTLGGNELYRGLGFNIPGVAYDDAIGNEAAGNRLLDADKKITWINEVDDFIACLKYYSPNKIRAFLMWMKTMLFAQRFAIYNWRDPLPVLVKTFRHLTGASVRIRNQHYEPIC